MLKILAIAVVLFGWMGVARATPRDTTAVDTARHVRSPRGAMLRSLALPGWGQFYNGHKIKGTLIATAEVGSVAAFFVRRHQLARASSGSGRNVYLFTTIGIVLYSMGDAYVDANLDAVKWGPVELSPGSDGKDLQMDLNLRF